MSKRSATVRVSSLLVALLTCTAAHSQHTGAVSFEGKTLTVLIGANAGGGLDTPARLFARHLSRNVAGAPSVVASNMPGAASIVAARHMFTQAPKDGSMIAVLQSGMILEAQLGSQTTKGFDPTAFTFLGSLQSFLPVCLVRQDAPVKSASDLLKMELIVGASTPGSPNYDFPLVVNRLANTKFKIVTGYAGNQALMLALERNEVQGLCVGWAIVKYRLPNILAGHPLYRIIMQGEAQGEPELTAAGVPLVTSVMPGEAEKQAIELFLSQFAYSGMVVAPPGTPENVVQALRKGVEATIKDPEFLAEGNKTGIELNLNPAEKVIQEVAKAKNASPGAVQLLKAALKH